MIDAFFGHQVRKLSQLFSRQTRGNSSNRIDPR
jgi:hypothetical protein